MNSKDYWAKREAEQLKHYVKDEAEYDKQIKRIYTETLDNVQKEIDSFYGKYAAKEGISLAEAKKRVSQLDIAAYERKAARYVKDKDFSPKANEEMRLYNATMKINRLELLKANIGLELISGTEELNKYMEGILQGRTEEELKRQAGILGKTIKNNAAKAHAIVNSSFHNATFSDRIWLYQDLLRNDLNGLLQSGLIQGKNPRLLARDIKKKFDVSTYNAERLMRTELARVQTEAQKQSFERNGFTEYEFIVNGGCCDICAALSGKHFKVAKMMPGENAPPMHPHCRCSTAAYEDSAEYNAWLDYLDKGGSTEEWDKLDQTTKNDLIKAANKKLKLENSEKGNIIKNEQQPQKEAEAKPQTNKQPEYKHISDAEFAEWKRNCSTCTKEEYKQIAKHEKADGKNGGYVRSHRAWEFNAELRAGKESLLDADDKKTLNTIRKLCKQNKTDRAVILDRYVDSDYLTEYNGFFNKFRSDLIDDAATFVNNNLIGKSKTEKSIVSASYATNVLTDRDVHIRLHCPEGTHMFVTNNKRESEVLFHDGLTYEIKKAYKEAYTGLFGDKHRLVIDVEVLNNGL